MAKKRIMFLACTLLILLGSVVYVFAANGTKNISVAYRNIVIKVNNAIKQTDQEPFIYNSYTYVPLRFVSESLNANVQWDDKTSTISITSANPADSDAVKAIEQVKWFTDSAYDVYRAVEVLYINNTLYYHIAVSSDTGQKDDVYYNTSDTLLYTYIDGKLGHYQ